MGGICGGAACCGVCEGVVVAGRAAVSMSVRDCVLSVNSGHAPSAAKMALMSGVAMVYAAIDKSCGGCRGTVTRRRGAREKKISRVLLSNAASSVAVESTLADSLSCVAKKAARASGA